MAFRARPPFGAVRSALAKRPKFHWPTISVTTVWFLLPVLTSGAMGLGWIAASLTDIWLQSALIGVGIVLVATVLVLCVIIVHSNANTIAPLFMMRYGVNERVRAQNLVMDMMMASDPGKFQVVAGKLGPVPSDDNNSRKAESTPPDPKAELFRITGYGNTDLFIDLESAVLVEREGKYTVFHWPKCELHKHDRYIDSVSLRPQREPLDVKGALTHDTIAIDLKGAVIFQIQQSKQHLEQTQSHLGDAKAIKRALLPRNEWMQRTKMLLTSAVHTIVRECDLWQIYAAPPKPPTPAEMATIYTLGQAILPHSTRVELEDRIKVRLNDSCWQWGVEVIRVLIEEINPPIEIRDAAYRAYLSWNNMSEQILEAEKAAQSKLRTAQIEYDEMILRRKAVLLDADTAKQKVILEAEGDADAYTKRMHARAEGALEFARRMEIIEQGLGHRMDEGAMRELLRALGFLQNDKADDEPKWLMDYMARRGYAVKEE